MDVSANRAFPHAPKTTAAIGFDWQAAKGDWGKLNLYGDLSYVSKLLHLPLCAGDGTTRFGPELANSSKSKGRTIVNLRASLSRHPGRRGHGRVFGLRAQPDEGRRSVELHRLRPRVSVASCWATSPNRAPLG
jgi:hypothetical protein